MPGVVVDYLASQIKVADPSCVKTYLERRSTRFEHQAWATGDGPKALFYSAVARLRAERVLLPEGDDATR